MLFESLYSLICEYNKANVLTHDTLIRYYYYHIGSDIKDVKAIYKYLQDNNVPKMHCIIVEDIGQDGDRPYYFLLVAKVMNKSLRKEFVKKLLKLISEESRRRITQYGEYPAEDLESGTQYDYDPMGKYDLDDKTKEIWKDVIPEL